MSDTSPFLLFAEQIKQQVLPERCYCDPALRQVSYTALNMLQKMQTERGLIPGTRRIMK